MLASLRSRFRKTRPTGITRLPSTPAVLCTLAFATLLLSACRTDRLVGERAPIAKAYHNFTSHYNGYFNAAELITEAEASLAASETRNFDELLEVYPAYSVTNPSAVSGSLDQAMEKVSLVVNIHRPSSFEDDSYLLLGRAQLLKQDYAAAQNTFEYALKDFDPSNEAARLKRIEKQRLADLKEREKAERAEAVRTGRTPAPRRASPKRRNTSPRSRAGQRNSRSKSKGSKGKKSKRSRKPEATEGDKRRSRDQRMREQREAAAEQKAEEKSKGKKGRNSKPKSRSEMAREQREARMAEVKAAEQAAEQAAKDAAQRGEDEAAQAAAAADAEAQAELDRLTGNTPDRGAEDTGDLDPLADGEGFDFEVDDDEKPKSGLFVHETALQDMQYWLARTYIAQEKFLDAERTLGQLARSGSTFKNIRRRLPAAYAELYIAKEDYASAAPFLEDAIEMSRKRADKARYAYLLGQLRERLGNGNAAYAAYEQVIDLKPNPELAFEAELHLATTGFRSGISDDRGSMKMLRKMSREDKYSIYRDQIFHEMAEISLASGDQFEALGYFRESLDNQGSNPAQAAKSFRRLGEIYLEAEDYALASAYYDSTMQVLPQSATDYAEVAAIRDNLNPIARNIATITLQDSLIAISELSPEDQRDLALKLRQEQIDAERARAIADAQSAALSAVSARGKQAPRTPNRLSPGGPNVNLFFAYDAKSLRRGEKAFRREWGERPLGDDWRILDDREAIATLDDGVVANIVTSALGDDELDAFLGDVPNDEASLVAAEALIDDALLALGRQYRDNLANPARAAESLVSQVQRFPSSQNRPEALYLLALAYDDLNRSADAAAIRRQLTSEFGDSKYARSISDPDFSQGASAAEAKLVAFYDRTYNLFQAGDTTLVQQRLAEVTGEFGADNALAPRFALFGASVAGKMQGRDAYIEALRGVVAEYPESPEGARAKEIMGLLGERTGAVAALDGAAETGLADNSAFSLTPDKSHYFLAVLPKGAPMAKAKAAVADYNGEHHRLDKLAIGNVFVMNDGEQTPTIVIRRFATQVEAMAYYKSIDELREEFMPGIEFNPVVISQNNYREVLRNKSFADYLSFFAANYL